MTANTTWALDCALGDEAAGQRPVKGPASPKQESSELLGLASQAAQLTELQLVQAVPALDLHIASRLQPSLYRSGSDRQLIAVGPTSGTARSSRVTHPCRFSGPSAPAVVGSRSRRRGGRRGLRSAGLSGRTEPAGPSFFCRSQCAGDPPDLGVVLPFSMAWGCTARAGLGRHSRGPVAAWAG